MKLLVTRAPQAAANVEAAKASLKEAEETKLAWEDGVAVSVTEGKPGIRPIQKKTLGVQRRRRCRRQPRTRLKPQKRNSRRRNRNSTASAWDRNRTRHSKSLRTFRSTRRPETAARPRCGRILHRPLATRRENADGSSKTSRNGGATRLATDTGRPSGHGRRRGPG